MPYQLDSHLMFAFLLVFVRCSALFFAAPVFGSQSTPVSIRVLTTLAFAGALATAVAPPSAQLPPDLYHLFQAVIVEALAGLTIGFMTQLLLRAAEMAGSMVDMQIGLGSSQMLNPATGVPSTVLSQFQYLLALVVFLTVNGHHMLIQALVRSYDAVPNFSLGMLPNAQSSILDLCGIMSLAALQIAAPVLAVSILIDAALGIMNRAVPQMQIYIVGLPGKIGLGLLAIAISLPAMTGVVSNSVDVALTSALKLITGGS